MIHNNAGLFQGCFQREEITMKEKGDECTIYYKEWVTMRAYYTPQKKKKKNPNKSHSYSSAFISLLWGSKFFCLTVL